MFAGACLQEQLKTSGSVARQKLNNRFVKSCFFVLLWLDFSVLQSFGFMVLLLLYFTNFQAALIDFY